GRVQAPLQLQAVHVPAPGWDHTAPHPRAEDRPEAFRGRGVPGQRLVAARGGQQHDTAPTQRRDRRHHAQAAPAVVDALEDCEALQPRPIGGAVGGRRRLRQVWWTWWYTVARISACGRSTRNTVPAPEDMEAGAQVLFWA